MKTAFAACSLLAFLFSAPAHAATEGETPSARDKPVKAVPQTLQLQPREALPKLAVERRALKLSCPEAGELKLRLLPYPSGGWSITPAEVSSVSFGRAYGQLYPNEPTKVSLACLYEASGAYTARVSYNGLQKCIANEATGEGKIEYTSNLSGYTSNVAGTSKPGYLDSKKTSQQVEGQTLACQHQLSGKAQFFKVFNAPSKILSCDANGREVSCYY